MVSNKITPSGVVPEPVMSLRTTMPALANPVMFCCDVTSVVIVAVFPIAGSWTWQRWSMARQIRNRHGRRHRHILVSARPNRDKPGTSPCGSEEES